MKKVLYIATNSDLGGISKYLLEIVRYLPKDIVPYFVMSSAGYFSEELEKFGISKEQIHFIPMTNSIFDIKTHIKSNIAKNIPTILTIHDAGLICPAGTLMLGNKEFCNKNLCNKNNVLPCILNNCSANIEQSIRKSLRAVVERNFIKYIDKFITPSDALRNVVVKANIGINNEQIITINNFLEDSELNTIPNYTNKKYFLYVGRLSKEKGLIYLLKSIKELPSNIDFHIVGTGDQESFLKQYAQDNNLKNVQFLGHKNHNELKEEYQNCISTILPCTWFEIFGLTNIESFINGKPIIASNIGGIPEIVENDVTGLLFKPANVEELKKCILKYWENPELAILHGKNGYHKALKEYTEDNYFSKLIQVYNDVYTKYNNLKLESKIV